MPMCGRLAIYSPIQVFADLLDAQSSMELDPSYNVAPSGAIPACRLDTEGQRELVRLRWGAGPPLVQGAGHPLQHD